MESEILEPWFMVYSGSEKLDLGPKWVIAMFRFEAHAKQFAENWAPYGYVKPAFVVFEKKAETVRA